MEYEAVSCASCRVDFEDSASQRAHYKTDFHRYNLKRKVAELPPISYEDFQARLAASQKGNEPVDESRACDTCNKKFSSENAFQQHLRSRRHRDKAAQGVKKGGASSKPVLTSANRGPLGAVDNSTYRSGDTGAAGSSAAPAAGSSQPTPAAAAATTATATATAGAEDEILDEDAQLEAILAKATFLTEKQCIFCRSEFDCFEDTLEHVTKKHSFFIPDLEFVTNIQDLYMYLSQKVSVGMVCLWCNKQLNSLEAIRGHMESKAHWKMRYEEDTTEYDEFYDFSASYPEGTGPVPGLEGEDDGTRDLIIPPGAQRAPVGVSDTGYDLVLSDGSTIGHRSLHRYYKQRYRPEESRHAVLQSRLYSKYKQLGYGDKWTPPTRAQKTTIEKQKYHHLKVGVKANKLQHHFRLQNPM